MPGYVELHCKTNYSFLVGASHADELVDRALAQGYRGLAITDESSLAGVVRAYAAARDKSLQLIYGAEVCFADTCPLVLWSASRKGYGNLCQLITQGRRRAEKGACELHFSDLTLHHEQLLAGVLLPEVITPAHLQQLQQYRELFGDRCYLLAELHRGQDDLQRLQELQQLAATSTLPLVASGGVLYHDRHRQAAQHLLTAIRLGTTVGSLRENGLPNAQYHLRSRRELKELFASCPGALERTLEIASRCQFSLAELRYDYPEELAPTEETPIAYLKRLAWQGAHWRYPDGIPPKVCNLLEHELQLIEELRYEAFFLTVYDAVQFARSRKILCQGRGSAANSAVCFCLGVTSVDPTLTDLLFERFISKERDEPPDIDVDFEHERREEVLQYLYEKYGRDRAGLAATVITYCARSAIRDTGKALGLSLDRVDALAKQVEGYRREAKLGQRCEEVGIDPTRGTGKQLVELVETIIGFPRHLSQHVGGMVITGGALSELVPIENAAMEDRTVIQWDKDDLEELGILKVDCLCLGMLTAIRKCFGLLEEHTGQSLHLANIPSEDRAVYDMICRADTVGVFQIESRGQMSMLPRLRPRTFYDLVIEVAIVRPGPIQGQMVHPFLRRRQGLEEVSYPNAAIREVLEKTMGVPIFQEQAMRLAVVAAGFTPGEADQLRRAMAAWRKPGIIEEFRIKLMEGMLAGGLSLEFAERVYQQLRGFGEYGFPESHAASFALLVYASAWLKCHYPAFFAAALLNSQPLGFYAPAQLVRDARDHGVKVLPVDIQYSDWDCTLERLEDFPTEEDRRFPGKGCFALRLGLRMIRGMREEVARAIMAKRQEQPYHNFDDFVRRTEIGKRLLQDLVHADVFSSLDHNRRQALWQALGQEQGRGEQPLFSTLVPDEELPDFLPAMDTQEEMICDYQSQGLSLRAHPLQFYRTQLEEFGVSSAEQIMEMPNGKHVAVAGIVLLRQRPSTAKGITFVTLEDETGTINLVVHQRTWERFYQIARRASGWLARGELQVADSIVHLIVDQIEDLSDRFATLLHRSRDFR